MPSQNSGIVKASEQSTVIAAVDQAAAEVRGDDAGA